MRERIGPFSAKHYDSREAGIDSRLLEEALEEMPRFLKDVKAEIKDLTPIQIFQEARRRAFIFLKIPGNLWGEYASAMGKMTGGKRKKMAVDEGHFSASSGFEKSKKSGEIFSSRQRESMIKESLGVIRQRGGDPDDLED